MVRFLLFAAFILCPKLGFSSGTGWVLDRFSGDVETDGIPKGWRPLFFKKIPRHTVYTVENDGSNFFVKAVSSASASAIFKEMPADFDLRKYPILRWRWKITKVLPRADATKKSGDDYPARIYVSFLYDPKRASAWDRAKYGAAKRIYGRYPPRGALNYIWDNRLPVGTTLNNAYTSQVKMIVCESGTQKTGQWITETRNVYQDYLRLLGQEPTPVAFVAIMNDSDNTGDFATSYFDDIEFVRPESNP